MKISAVIITWNEQRNIKRCIESLEQVVDEIVVVDSFSTDDTEKICRSLNVRFIQNPFHGHIEQKNFALDQASYDYVLSLDADEALSQTLRESIKQVKEHAEEPEKAYEMNRLTNYCGKWIYHCGWYPDRKIRFWNRKLGKWGGINPHDKVIMEQGIIPFRLHGDLLHYSFYSIDEHVNQINKFTSISANALYGEKTTGLVWIKMICSPFVRFIRDYFVKQGFRDGLYGFVICKNAAYSRFLRYAKLYTLILTRKNSERNSYKSRS